MAENRCAARIRRRMPCQLVADGRHQHAIVLDVSRTGLFVQTAARLRPGAVIDVLLPLEVGAEPTTLRARVARQRAVPGHLTSVAKGGIGLRLLDVPPAFEKLVDEVEPG